MAFIAAAIFLQTFQTDPFLGRNNLVQAACRTGGWVKNSCQKNTCEKKIRKIGSVKTQDESCTLKRNRGPLFSSGREPVPGKRKRTDEKRWEQRTGSLGSVFTISTSAKVVEVFVRLFLCYQSA